MRIIGCRAALCLAAGLLTGPAAGADWQPVRTVQGVPVESRGTAWGVPEFRAESEVCTDFATLSDYVADPEHFRHWIPFTEEARLLDAAEERPVYYLRLRTPWPLRSRDVIFALSPEPQWQSPPASHPPPQPDELRIHMQGLPDYLPAQHGAVRLQQAEGEWHLRPRGDAIGVRFRLRARYGRVPQFLASRRLAHTVGGALANLSRQFPCGGSGP